MIISIEYCGVNSDRLCKPKTTKSTGYTLTQIQIHDILLRKECIHTYWQKGSKTLQHRFMCSFLNLYGLNKVI